MLWALFQFIDLSAAVGQSLKAPTEIRRLLLADDSLNMLQREMPKNDWSWAKQAWLAGGAKAQNWPEFEQCLRKWYQQAKLELKHANQHPLAIHQWLHRIVLRQYQSDATNLAELLEGDYNCVSATLLYQLIARELGYKTRTVCLERHCRVAVWYQEQWLEIETTCAECHTPEALQLVTQQQRETTQKRSVDELGLLGLFLFNRAVDSLQSADHRRAATLNLLASEFDPGNQSARINLVAALNQLAIQSVQQQHHRAAHTWLSFALEIQPTDQTTQHNLQYLRSVQTNR